MCRLSVAASALQGWRGLRASRALPTTSPFIEQSKAKQTKQPKLPTPTVNQKAELQFLFERGSCYSQADLGLTIFPLQPPWWCDHRHASLSQGRKPWTPMRAPVLITQCCGQHGLLHCTESLCCRAEGAISPSVNGIMDDDDKFNIHS